MKEQNSCPPEPPDPHSPASVQSSWPYPVRRPGMLLPCPCVKQYWDQGACFRKCLLCEGGQTASLHTALTSDTNFKFGGSPDHLQFWKFTRKTHRTHWEHLYSLLWFITGKGYQLEPAEGRDAEGQVGKGPKCRVTAYSLHKKSVCDNFHREAPLCLWCPEFLLGLILPAWPTFLSAPPGIRLIPLVSSSSRGHSWYSVALSLHHIHIVRLSSGQTQANKDTLVRQDIPGA